jgi:hypothetical protein
MENSKVSKFGERRVLAPQATNSRNNNDAIAKRPSYDSAKKIKQKQLDIIDTVPDTNRYFQQSDMVLTRSFRSTNANSKIMMSVSPPG